MTGGVGDRDADADGDATGRGNVGVYYRANRLQRIAATLFRGLERQDSKQKIVLLGQSRSDADGECREPGQIIHATAD